VVLWGLGPKSEQKTRLYQFFLFSACSISTQHLTSVLGTTCCIRLATLLQYVATCWIMLDQIWKRSNFFVKHFRCCSRLATFTQHCWTTRMRARSTCCVSWGGDHKHPHAAFKMLRAFWPARSTHVATSCSNIVRCCVEILRVFGQAFTSACVIISN